MTRAWSGAGRRRLLIALVVLGLVVLAGVAVALARRGGDATATGGKAPAVPARHCSDPVPPTAAPGPAPTASPTAPAPSASPTPTSPAPPAPPPAVVHLAPQAAGKADGTSWADAGSLTDLPRLMAGLPPGGEVWLQADAGPYPATSTLKIGSGGACGAPVVVRGATASGGRATALLRGNRTTPYRASGGKDGTDVFSLRRGAGHLVFRDLALEDVGNAFIAAADVADITITDTTATNVRRFFEDYRTKGEPSASVVGLTVQRVTATGFSKRFLHLRYDSSAVLVEDVVGDSQEQDRDDFAIGVHLEGTAHDVVLRRVTMRGMKDTLHGYWNGDGFATERTVHDVHFEDTLSSGNTDAGYDLKSTRTTLVRVTARDNKRNFRLWADDLVLRDCQGLAPHKRGGSGSQAQIWLGKGAHADATGCTFRDTDPATVVFDLEPGAALQVDGGTVAAAGQVERTAEGADVTLRGVSR